MWSILRVYDLRQKEVINEKDCKIIGCVVDIEFDAVSGCIIALIIPGPGKLCGILGREMEYVIPFGCVRKIGDDIILVNVKIEDVYVKCKY